MHHFNRYIPFLSKTALLTWTIVLTAVVLPTSAQLLRPELRDPFLANPLEDEPRDPLLPDPPISRPLSPLEKLALDADLEALNRQAIGLLESDPEAAYGLWMREVRLQRLLGLDLELEALSRVGRQVWAAAGRSQEIQLLTARLQVIRDDLTLPEATERIEIVAQVFELLGAPDEAVANYRQLAEERRRVGDDAGYRHYFETIGVIQANWFQFSEAAATYTALLAETALTRDERRGFLQQLVSSYEQTQQWTQALTAQKTLLADYEESGQEAPIPELKRAMGDNHRALNQLEAASNRYQEAYEAAMAAEQFDVASQSIAALAALYRQLDRLEEVVYLYQQQVLVEQQAYDAYGVMRAYDSLGQAYEVLGQTDEAMAAYREGLILAQHLNHDQGYFRTQIRRLKSETNLEWRE